MPTRLLAALGLGLLASAAARPVIADLGTGPTYVSPVEELLEADRGFSQASAATDLISALSAMFAPDVLMPIPGNGFAEGAIKALEALRSNPDNARSKLRWTPIRAGISADGLHGFTFGFMTMTKPDGTEVPLKYMAYWVKGRDGWRVAGYKRRPRAVGEVSSALMAPAVPPKTVAPTADTAQIERFRRSLDQAERSFSDEAQKIGLGPAFAKFGSDDAVNMGGPANPGYVVGAQAIAKTVSEGGPATGSEVSWAPDRVLVASSGDLGITFGIIRPNQPAAGGPTGFPFFTIWRRASPNDPWRYVAE